MSTIWPILIISSCFMLIFSNPGSIVGIFLESSANSFQLCISLVSIYAVWLGIINIVDRSGLGEKLSKLLSPIIRILFKSKNEDANKYIAINISSNLLGLGNAATPSGIKAMQLLDDKSGKITYSGIVLLLINSISIQLIPTTVIGLKQASSSKNPTDIVFPTIITSILTLLFVILIIYILEKLKLRKS